MKRFLYILMAALMLVTAEACSDTDKDMPDNDVIWDIYPAGVAIQLVDEAGNNLLDPEVESNWVDEPMWIECNDKVFDIAWTKDNLQHTTKALMPHFNGASWTGIWSDKNYYLYFGEFAGESSLDLKLTFAITKLNIEYDFEFTHRLVWKNKEPHFDDHITYNGNRIEGNSLTLVIPKNLSVD